MEVGGQRHHAPAALPLVRKASTLADLDECGKTRPHRDSIPGPSCP